MLNTAKICNELLVVWSPTRVYPDITLPILLPPNVSLRTKMRANGNCKDPAQVFPNIEDSSLASRIVELEPFLNFLLRLVGACYLIIADEKIEIKS